MNIPDRIKKLIDVFHTNLESYKKSGYKEAQVRIDYVNPFFEELGWDVSNAKGLSEAYREVIHESSIKIGGAAKAPDYCFRVGGERKFFLEAKKPSVNIKESIHPAYQLRRYGWSAKLPVSILTDFEEFAVYDCRVKPAKTDKASRARILYLKYTDYAQKWEEIASVFSRDAVVNGSLEKYAESDRTKKGTEEVDEAFLREIERWREVLARSIALRNPNLSQRELNFAVQQTIDRIVFLRICEDRGIETYGSLMALENGENVYKRLSALFRKADEKYNSDLFHFRKEKHRENFDRLTPGLSIDDKPLRDILKNLYYPDSPYEFSVLPADILGQVYEKFLGKIIRLTPSHQAKIEEKPEVRKAGGVYYTPTYIVNYIVKNTVGKLLDGKKPGSVKNIRILDPACGSGSFLIGAYQFLLDWHLEQYAKDSPEKKAKGKKPVLYQTDSGDWHLTAGERKRILLNHIYGVDIDSQAVEVTKLSLLLKVLEGENEQSIQMSVFQERILPDLSNNIKCGNSLIGPDFYANQQIKMNAEEMYRVNAFDWNAEFGEIMKAGGFDAVIGNPPYVRQETLGDAKPYFQKHFSVYQGTADLYVYFIEKSLSLLHSDGFFGFIVSNKWMRANYGKPLRQWMKHWNILEIADFGDLPVFGKVSAYPCILAMKKSSPEKSFMATQIKSLKFENIADYIWKNHFDVKQSSLEDDGWALGNDNLQNILDKLRKTGLPLGDYADGKIYSGIKTGLNEAFIIKDFTREKLIAENSKNAELIRPFLLGKEIKRYQPPNGDSYVIFMPKGWTNQHKGKEKDAWKWLKNSYPSVASHLNEFSKKAQKRYDKGDYWWELRACDYYSEFEKPKILLPDISNRNNFTFDSEGKYYCVNAAYIISNGEKYLLGILNSALMTFYYKNISSTYRGGYLRFIYQYLVTLPIRTIDFTNSHDKSLHDQMVSLVERMLDLHKKNSQSVLPQEKTVLQRQIEATDKQIDQLVYKLYDLTDKEIQIVEGERQ